jgi:ATP-dependent DNA helicase MPH1
MWPELSAIKLHPYAARAKMSSLAPDQRGFIGQLSMLGNLAQVMGYLVCALFYISTNLVNI